MFIDNNHIAYVKSTQMFHILFPCGPKKLVKSPEEKAGKQNQSEIKSLHMIIARRFCSKTNKSCKDSHFPLKKHEGNK